MRLLFLHAEGLGNILQSLPLLATLQEAGHEVDVGLVKANTQVPGEFISGHLVMDARTLAHIAMNIDAYAYDGLIWTDGGYSYLRDGACPELALCGLKALNPVHKYSFGSGLSEVDTYLLIAKDLGIPEQDFIYDCRHKFNLPRYGGYDVVLCNGYNRNSHLKMGVKSWPGHERLAAKLIEKGLSVASVGLPGEGVPGTEDRTVTGEDLVSTAAIIRFSRLFISNDTGLYHLACALQVPTLVLFTSMDPRKNYDHNFHKTARVIRRQDLSCMGLCQQNHTWLKCDHWSCRYISVDEVFRNAMNLLGMEE